jgi:exodeoxyribonuclease VII small subunit
MTTRKRPKDFESAIERLEEITDKLEGGEVSLEESIKLYTEGLEIAVVCDKKLAEAEKKIKIIQEKSGSPVEQEFEEEEEEDDAG